MNPTVSFISSSLRRVLFTGSCALLTLSSACQEDDVGDVNTAGSNGSTGTQGGGGPGASGSGGTQGNDAPKADGATETTGEDGPTAGASTGTTGEDATGTTGGDDPTVTTGGDDPTGDDPTGTTGGDSPGGDGPKGPGGEKVPGVIDGIPSLAPPCAKNLKIEDPKNGIGVEFSADCSVAYVLPPITGASQLSTFAQSLNLGFCSALKSAASIEKSKKAVIEMTKKRLQRMRGNLKVNIEETKTTQAEITQTNAKLKSASEALAPEQTKLDRLDEALELARTKMKECKEEADEDDKDACSAEAAAVTKAREAFNDQRAIVKVLKEPVTNAELKLKQLERALERLQEKKSDLEESIAEEEEFLKKSSEGGSSMLDEYIVLEGATGNVFYKLGWDKLIQSYKDENPGFSGRFAPVPLDDLRLHFTAKIGESARYAGALGVSDLGLGGLSAAASQTVVSGEPVSDEPAPFRFKKGEIETSLVSDSLKSANVSLSLAGACGAYDDEAKTLSQEELSKTLVLSMSYSYKLAVRRQYVAKYSMAKWLDEIKANQTSFTAESLKEATLNAGSSEWMSVDFSGNDPEFEYSPQEKAAITTDVSDTLQNNALNQLALQTGITLAEDADSNDTQAQVQRWARDNRASCGAFSFCYIADYMGSNYSKIWADEAQIEKFKESNSKWQTREVRGTKTLRRFGSIRLLPSDESLVPTSPSAQ